MACVATRYFSSASLSPLPYRWGSDPLRYSERAGDDFAEFLPGQDNGIPLHAAGLRRLFHQEREIARGHAVGAQRRNLQSFAQGGDPTYTVRGGGLGPSSEETRHLVVTYQFFRGSRAQRADVDLHGVGQQPGTDRAVGSGPHAADGGGKAVDRAQPGVGQRHAAQQAGPCHVAAGFAVAAVLPNARQGPGGAPHAFHAELVGHRIGAQRDVGLDQLGERVEAGGGGDGAREFVGEFGIDHGQARQHRRAAQAGFDTVFGAGEHGIAGDFAARAGGGGDGDARGGGDGERPAQADHFEIIQRVAGIGEQGGDGFAGVERAAAAEGDDEIAIARGGADEVERGLAGDDEEDGRYVGGFEGLAEWGGAVGRRSGDEEGAAAHGCGGGGDLAQRSLAEEDAGGGGEFKWWHGVSRRSARSQDTMPPCPEPQSRSSLRRANAPCYWACYCRRTPCARSCALSSSAPPMVFWKVSSAPMARFAPSKASRMPRRRWARCAGKRRSRPRPGPGSAKPPGMAPAACRLPSIRT